VFNNSIVLCEYVVYAFYATNMPLHLSVAITELAMWLPNFGWAGAFRQPTAASQLLTPNG
jgi:hypothetical protein